MSDVSAFYTATIARQLKGLSDAVITRSELLNWMKKKGRIRYGLGGDTIKARIYSSEPAVGGATSVWGTRSAQTISPFTTVEFNYRQYDWAIVMSDFEMQRNANAGPEAQMFKMFAESMNAVRQSATGRLSRHAYRGNADSANTGDQGTPIDGLADIVDNTSNNTYAGIARSGSTTYWNNQYGSISNFTLDADGDDVPDGLTAMRDLWLDCSAGKAVDGESIGDTVAVEKETPDAVLTTAAIYLNYNTCLTPQERFSNGNMDPEKTLTFNGVPIMWDNFCPSGLMYMLNSRHIHLDCCGKNLIEQGKDQDVIDRNAHVWKLISQLQMYSRNPRYHGVLVVS